MRRIVTTACMLAAAAGLYAAEPADRNSGSPLWRQTSPGMSYDDYLASVDHNQRLVKQQLQLYADRLVREAGGYGQAIGLAAAVAVTDTRLRLDRRGRYAMVFSDTMDSDRAVMVQYRARW